jgi:hypothetical protein
VKILDLIRELSAYAVSEGNVEVMISLCDLDNHYRYGRIECDSVLLNGNVCLDCEEVKPYDYEEQETDLL